MSYCSLAPLLSLHVHFQLMADATCTIGSRNYYHASLRISWHVMQSSEEKKNRHNTLRSQHKEKPWYRLPDAMQFIQKMSWNRQADHSIG